MTTTLEQKPSLPPVRSRTRAQKLVGRIEEPPTDPRTHVRIPEAKFAPKNDVVKPDRVGIPPLPTQENPQLRDEQQVARVEALMLKGIRDRAQLGKLLNVADPRQMERYIRRVYARWEVTGGGTTIKRFRGEALHRLDLLENQLWMTVANTGNVSGDNKGGIDMEAERVKIVALKQIADIGQYKDQIRGLSQAVCERLNAAGDDNEVHYRMLKSEKMKNMFLRLGEIATDVQSGGSMATPTTSQDVHSPGSTVIDMDVVDYGPLQEED